MTKAVLLSAENILKAKEAIKPLIQDFLKVEPGNTLVIPETKQGMALVDAAIRKLEAIGYSQEEGQFLINELVDTLSNG